MSGHGLQDLVKSGETVVNMFSGVGCFSIIIAKTVTQTLKCSRLMLTQSAVPLHGGER